MRVRDGDSTWPFSSSFSFSHWDDVKVLFISLFNLRVDEKEKKYERILYYKDMQIELQYDMHSIN